MAWVGDGAVLTALGFGFGFVFGVIAEAQDPWFKEGITASFKTGFGAGSEVVVALAVVFGFCSACSCGSCCFCSDSSGVSSLLESCSGAFSNSVVGLVFLEVAGLAVSSPKADAQDPDALDSLLFSAPFEVDVVGLLLSDVLFIGFFVTLPCFLGGLFEDLNLLNGLPLCEPR